MLKQTFHNTQAFNILIYFIFHFLLNKKIMRIRAIKFQKN